MNKTVRYCVFAMVSIALNIGSQDVVINIYTGRYNIILSIILGTLVGLLVKYELDKRFIFEYTPANPSHNARLFVIYATMGLVTTAIFWGTELAFHFAYNSDTMRYIGGIIGLSVGYYLKYMLDKRFVFTHSDSHSSKGGQ